MSKYKEILTFGSLPYLFLISAMFHIGYWNQFEINILGYLSLTDSINGILLPLIIYVVPISSILISALIIFYLKGLIENKIGDNWKGVILFIPFMLPLFYIIYYLNMKFLFEGFYWPDILNFFLFLLMFFLYLSIIHSKRKDTSTLFASIKQQVIIILILLPMFTFLAGTSHGLKVIKKDVYNEVETKLLKDPMGLGRYKSLIYLGKGGDTYFFISPDFKFKLITDKSNFVNLIYFKTKKNPDFDVNKHGLFADFWE